MPPRHARKGQRGQKPRQRPQAKGFRRHSFLTTPPPRSRAERSGPPGAKRKGAKRSGCPATRRPTSPKRGERPRLGGELFEPRAGHYRPRRVESRPKRGHETSGNNQKPKAPPPQATNWPPCSAACACRAAGEAHGKPPIPPKRAPTALK